MGKLDKINDLVSKGKTDKLIKLSDDKDEEVAAAAFVALGEIGDASAYETLQNAIRDPSPTIRLAVARGFQKCGDDHVVEALRRQMMGETDPRVKQELERAINFCRGHRR